MLRDYRAWLTSELAILGNASHHAYAFGQANMAKRALEELDSQLAKTLVIEVDAVEARRALTELESLDQRDSARTPGLARLRTALRSAVDDVPVSGETPGADENTTPV